MLIDGEGKLQQQSRKGAGILHHGEQGVNVESLISEAMTWVINVYVSNADSAQLI